MAVHAAYVTALAHGTMKRAWLLAGAALAGISACDSSPSTSENTAPFTVFGRAVMEGRVTARDGRGLEFVAIALRGPGSTVLIPSTPTTDTAGRYRLLIDLTQGPLPGDTVSVRLFAAPMPGRHPLPPGAAPLVEGLTVVLRFAPTDRPAPVHRVDFTLAIP